MKSNGQRWIFRKIGVGEGKYPALGHYFVWLSPLSTIGSTKRCPNMNIKPP